MATTPAVITRAEREDLLRICRLRAKVAKDEVGVLAAARKADFEQQLASEYSFDQDEVWRKAREAAMGPYLEAAEQIRRRCEELGIPRRFAPSLGPPYWSSRGENAVRSRRVELTKVAYRRIEQHEKDGKLAVDRASAKIQTELIACTLGSEAKALLESIPTPAQLMPAVTVADVQKQLGPVGVFDDEDAT